MRASGTSPHCPMWSIQMLRSQETRLITTDAVECVAQNVKETEDVATKSSADTSCTCVGD